MMENTIMVTFNFDLQTDAYIRVVSKKQEITISSFIRKVLSALPQKINNQSQLSDSEIEQKLRKELYNKSPNNHTRQLSTRISRVAALNCLAIIEKDGASSLYSLFEVQ